MSLTVRRGQFGENPAGTFNTEFHPPGPLLFWDPVPYRVRAIFNRETIVDSRRVLLLHERRAGLPVYYFPEDDLRQDLLVPSDKTSDCAHKGRAKYRSIRVGDRIAADAVCAYEEPVDSARFLAGYATVEWDAIDEWFVEDEQAFGHPRDPYSRIDVFKTTRHVRVLLAGEELASSRRTKLLVETALPPRYYFPPEDVRTELLIPSAKRTRCAYKGSAAYWHLQLGMQRHDDLVWAYPCPQHDAEPVRDYFCFFNERVDLELDGDPQERPQSQWS